jgi:hypothetical protein
VHFVTQPLSSRIRKADCAGLAEWQSSLSGKVYFELGLSNDLVRILEAPDLFREDIHTRVSVSTIS